MGHFSYESVRRRNVCPRNYDAHRHLLHLASAHGVKSTFGQMAARRRISILVIITSIKLPGDHDESRADDITGA